ncbi:MAG: 30S ribosomal protein S16, partial [Alteromonas sp.]|nr:30S ribosomal protein S16 [Alteromonas sp.]
SEGLTADAAFAEGIKYALNMDSTGLAAQEEAYEAKQKAKSDAADARKAKREAAAQAKAAAAADAVSEAEES